MNNRAGDTSSIWMATAERPPLSPLSGNRTAQVCIIGAGIAGLTAAYLLAREGRSVVVLDDGVIGGGMTERTTAHLSNALGARYFDLERLHGEKGARLISESHLAAVDRIETIVKAESIDCDFERVDGYLFLAEGDSEDVLKKELAALHRAGFTGAEMVAGLPLDYEAGPVIRFPAQGQFHPLKYLTGLAKAIVRDGGAICTGTHATTITAGGPVRVETSGGFVVTADAVIVATNVPVNDRVVIHTKQAPYLSYAIGCAVPRGAVPRSLYWDTADPYHYVRLQKLDDANDLLIVGGEDHKTGQADDGAARHAALEKWMRVRFTAAQKVDYRWSGQVMESMDHIAFIGPNPLDGPNVYVVTGDSGNGITHGTIAGILLTDLIAGRENEWASLYDPSRKTLRAVRDFATENLNVLEQFKDYLTPGDVSSIAEISPGTGAIIRHGLTKVAVYKTEAGVAQQMSAICPHLGCVVDWNSTEKTWDCPCHGSRFDCNGKVINGPANSDLPPVNAVR